MSLKLAAFGQDPFEARYPFEARPFAIEPISVTSDRRTETNPVI